MLDALAKDIGFAARWLRRCPGFTLAATASLAIGIGFNTAFFSIVDAILFRPLPVESPQRLVDIFTNSADGDRYSTSSYPDFLDLRSQNVVFEDVLGFSPMIAALTVADRQRMALGEVVTGNYFQMLGVGAALGRTLLPEDDTPGAERAVMISDRYWQRELGSDPQVVGRTVRLRGQLYTIVGVARRGFAGMFPILSTEMWLPVVHVAEVEPAGIQESVPSPTGTNRLDRRGDRWIFIKGRLKPGATLEQARANLDMLMRQLTAIHPQTNKDRIASVLSTSAVRIHPEASAILTPIAGGMMAAFGLVLLVACANVASMLLARASARQREIGIRLALGASRSRLVRQLLTESCLLAILGAAAGVLLALWLIRIATTVQPPIPLPLSLDLRLDFRVLLFALALTTLAGFAAGLAPALRASRTDILHDLRGETGTAFGTRGWTLRDGLVAGQIGVTLVLLVAAGLLMRSLMAAQKANIGFRVQGLAMLSADLEMLRYDSERSRRFWEQAVARVRALPGVESAALAGRLPFSINFSSENFYIPGYHGTTERGTPIKYARVSPEYFKTLGSPILQGRSFTEADTPETQRVAIISETMAHRFWSGQDPLGKRIHMRGPEGPSFEVVGICADHKVRTVGEPPQPYIHLAQTQRPGSYYVLVARTRGDADRLLSDMRRELLALEPNLIFLDNQTMEAQVAATLFPARAGARIVGFVGFIATALAAIGLYGVISYSVQRRTREIGVRMALGATRSAVLALFMRRGLSVAGIGLLAGSALTAGSTRAVRSLLYGVSVIDPLAWGSAACIVLVASILANLIPAHRASRVDPSAAIRTE